MYFLPKNNLFYSYLINLHSSVRYFFIFFLIFLIFACWFFIFFKKLTNEQIDLVSNIEILRNKEKLLEGIKIDISNLMLKLQDINNQIDSIVNINFNCENNINLLIKNTKELNLIISSLNFDNYIAKQSYIKNIITFNFKGEIDKIIEFFKKLSLTQSWLKFKKINILSETENEIKVESICKFYFPQKGFKCLAKELS